MSSYTGDDCSFEKALQKLRVCVSFLLLNLEITSNVFKFHLAFNASHYIQTQKLYYKHLETPSKRVSSKGTSA